jgi:4-diphosphocytidyl-2-C-methyl-D-erythritol kinase
MSQISVSAYAKINLTLEVVRRLSNGYHELRTVFQQVALCDDVILENTGGGIDLTCNDAQLDVGPANLVWRAADMLRTRFCPQRGARIRLHKCIPVGGGLGGGSADAAATLIGLNHLWQVGLSQRDLMELGIQLGMDVPFCVLGGTALGKGRGEDLQSLPSPPPMSVVIAHPGVASSTAEAYASLRAEQMGDRGHTAAMAEAIRNGDRKEIAAGLYNVFEPNVAGRLPVIHRIKQLMLERGAWNASLTGSGACVFGLAGTLAQAENIAAAVRCEFPTVFVTSTR